jgi:RNA polymerase sigma-70 factor (ECF subfamily)
VDGTPHNPAAWLVTVARRRIVDRLRAESVAARKLPVLGVEAELTEEAQRVMADAGDQSYDERLRLVLLCAHPVLAPESAAALSLRLVVGVSTEDIARLFLVPVPTMAARLTRARKRLARESFELPVGDELTARLTVAADVAYLAFTAGYAPGSGPDLHRPDQAAEAIRLARVLRDVAPLEAPRTELDALLALMLLQHSRRDARVDHRGHLVLLPDQDRERWHHEDIDEAVSLLTPWMRSPGTRYLLQALVAAEHAIARTADDTDWPRIAARYRELEDLTGSPVVRLNRAVAVAEADGPQAGLALLDGLDLPGHRLPAVRGQLLLRLGRVDEARAELTCALEACANEAERASLSRLLPDE